MNKFLPVIIILFLGSIINAQEITSFKTVGTYDQYVPVVFEFKNKPFSISRPSVHQDRNWLAYGIATINGIGFGWGSGNTKIKLENFTIGYKNTADTGKQYSFVGKVTAEWAANGFIVYLRGNTTYYTDGSVIRNDAQYTAPSGTPYNNLNPVSIDTPGYNIPTGVYVNEMEINSNSKTLNDTSSNLLTYKDGNVGIGTDTPKTKLDVNGTITIPEFSTINIRGNDIFHGLKYSYNNFANTFVDGPILYGWAGGALGIKKEQGESIAIRWNQDGNVVISNKLEAKEIKVTESPTADFVFEEDYRLPTLQEVEQHIKEKKHLPEIASAKQMEKEGVNIGEFQIQLLQKIEELTLYIIEQNKRIEELEKK